MSESKWWGRLFKTDAVLGIGSMILGFAGTFWTSTSNSSPNLTSLGWLFAALAVTGIIIILFGAAGVAWNFWKSKEDKAVAKDVPREKSPPIKLTIIGRWHDSAFQMTKLGLDEHMRQLWGEDLVVKLEANEPLDNVLVRITAKNGTGHEIASLDGFEKFTGSIQKGFSESQTLYRRVFRRGQAKLEDTFPGLEESVIGRLDLSTMVFPDTEFETELKNHDLAFFNFQILSNNEPLEPQIVVYSTDQSGPRSFVETASNDVGLDGKDATHIFKLQTKRI